MVATFDGSPMPNHRISSGSSAILGIGNSADTIGRPAARAAEKMPMARPTARPAAVPMIQPGTMRFSDAVDMLHQRAVEPQLVERAHDGGRARQEERRQQARCSRPPATARSARRTRSTAATRRGTGRSRRRGRGRAVGALRHAASRARRWRPRRGSAPTACDARRAAGRHARAGRARPPARRCARISRMRPGRRDSTTTRSASRAASSRLWVT